MYRRLCAVLAALAMCASALGDFHDWVLTEIYSNHDGSVQFIELSCPNSGEGFLRGERLWCTAGDRTNVFTFPSDLSGDTADAKLLLATPGFGSLPGGVTPDFILPTNFLLFGTARLNYANVHIVNYTNLPTDGTASMIRSGSRFVRAPTNSPSNFAGQSGIIVPVRIQAITSERTNARISFATVSGKNYTLQFRDSLTNSAWQNIVTLPGNGSTRFVTNSLGSQTRRFYRLRVP